MTRSWVGRARGWAFVASVALNLFLIGWIVGGWARMPHRPPFAMAERLKDRLSASGFSRIGPDLAALDAQAAGLGARFEAVRSAVVAAAAATPFDPTALRGALTGLAATRTGEEQRMTERVVDLIGRLEAPDRRVFAETLFSFPPPPPPPPR